MEASDIHFLPPRTLSTGTKTRRQIQLDQQEALAHAATVVARRRPQPVRMPPKRKKREGSIPGTSIMSSKPSHSPTPPENSEVLAIIKSPPPLFFSTPFELDRTDRSLLHFYLIVIPRRIFGLSSQPLFDPTRDFGVPVMSTDTIVLKWTLYIAAFYMTETTTSLDNRRASIYTDMQRRLQNVNAVLEESTLRMLVTAGLVEARVGHLAFARSHYTGALQWLSCRNGLRSIKTLAFPLGMAAVAWLVIHDFPLFANTSALVVALNRMTSARGRQLPKPLRRYFDSDSQDSRNLAHLHMMNMMTSQGCQSFVDELVRITTGSGETLTPVVLTYMICAAAKNVNEWHGANPCLRPWQTIEFMRLLAFAPRGRLLMVKVMSNWLTGDGEEEIDLEEIKTEILEGWEMAHTEVDVVTSEVA